MNTSRRALCAPLASFFLTTSSLAFADEPTAPSETTAPAPTTAPPPSSAPRTPAPQPKMETKVDTGAQATTAPPRSDAPLQRITGHVLLGGTILTESNTPPLGTLRAGAVYWLDDIGIAASVEGSKNEKSMLLGADLGLRVLAAPGKSGPFAGGGIGITAYDVRRSGSLGFSGRGERGTLYAEVGLAARRLGLVSVRATVPMSALDGTIGEWRERSSGERFVDTTGARVAPIAITGMLGVMF